MNVWRDTWVKNGRVLSICIVLAIAILAVFLQVKDHAFITLDDTLCVTENPHVQAGLTIENLKWAFTTTHAPYWHPLTWLSHMLDVQLFGLKAGGHHLVNVFFHIANTLLLFLVLRRMTKTLWRSAFVAALFALHPLHVESVAWVTERKDVLSTLFWILTLGAYTYYAERPGYRRYLLVLVCFVLGLMSKPMLVTLPFVLLLLDFWPIGRLQPAKHAGPDSLNSVRPQDPPRKKRKSADIATEKAADREEWLVYPLRWRVMRPLLVEKAPLLVFAALSSVITIINQQRAMVSLQAMPVDARIANALVSYVKYIGMMIWPFDLAVFYPHPDKQPVWLVLGAALALAVVTFLVIRKTNRFPYLVVGWLWYLGTLLPVIGLFQAGSQEMADRFTYVPMVGILIMVAWGIPDSLKKWGHRKTALGILSGIAILACAVLTWAQVQLWRDSITLFSHTLKVTRDNFIAHNNMGTALSDQGKIEEAITHYRSALRIAPGYDEAWNNLGSAYGKSGQTAKAIEAIRQALRINPEYDVAWNNLGNAYGGNGETAKAIEALQQAIRINTMYTKAWNNIGIAYAESGRTDEAIEAFLRCLHIKPGQADVWSNLAFAYRKHGQTAKAINAYREALRINPLYVNALFGLGVASVESGQTTEVEDIYRKLRTLDPAAAEEFSRRMPLPGK